MIKYFAIKYLLRLNAVKYFPNSNTINIPYVRSTKCYIYGFNFSNVFNHLCSPEILSTHYLQ